MRLRQPIRSPSPQVLMVVMMMVRASARIFVWERSSPINTTPHVNAMTTPSAPSRMFMKARPINTTDRRNLKRVPNDIKRGVAFARCECAQINKEEHLRQRHDDLGSHILDWSHPMIEGNVRKECTLPE